MFQNSIRFVATLLCISSSAAISCNDGMMGTGMDGQAISLKTGCNACGTQVSTSTINGKTISMTSFSCDATSTCSASESRSADVNSKVSSCICCSDACNSKDAAAKCGDNAANDISQQVISATITCKVGAVYIKAPAGMQNAAGPITTQSGCSSCGVSMHSMDGPNPYTLMSYSCTNATNAANEPIMCMLGRQSVIQGVNSVKACMCCTNSCNDDAYFQSCSSGKPVATSAKNGSPSQAAFGYAVAVACLLALL